MSSRNRYLKAAERSSAGKLYESISNVAKAVRRGSDPMAACSDAAHFLTEEGFHKIEYLRVLDAETFRDYQGAGRPGRVFVAAWLGKARLIDNIAV
jgi:pantoate--beta-alanine ligase